MKNGLPGQRAAKTVTDITYTDRVIQLIQELNWRALSSDLRHQSKRCLLDALGALIAGAKTPPAHTVAKIAEEQFPGSETTILVRDSKASAKRTFKEPAGL
jgi:2-methylcitrate dehydratase PrpD